MFKMTICTTPIRPIPTGFPPIGSMAIIQALKKINLECDFYNIDYFRHTEEEIIKYFKVGQFKIVAISAVVSTAYAYTKYLSALIKKCLPGSIIILGGNLAASAEILLRKTDVDICIVGDGEFIIQDLVSLIISHRDKIPKNNELEEIKGICFINKDNEFIFTGFGRKPTSEEIEYPDYKILEKDNSLSYFIKKSDLDQAVLANTPESFIQRWSEFKNKGNSATVISTKGCVARCTFCHRWEKGYRVSPIENLLSHIDDLNKHYNVTHIDFGDENFGADKKFTREFVRRLGQLGFTWEASGVRVRTVNFDDLKLWKENGCVRVICGIESGSEKMLGIMEKNATVQENINALKWLSELQISTVSQLVIGMPGENDETIYETIDFLKKVSDFSWDWSDIYPSELISVNYAQALPGTPLYEYAREKNFIGDSIDLEEDYLLKISDTDAYAEDHFVNLTHLPLLKVLAWRALILTEVDLYHAKSKLKLKDLSFFEVFSYYLGFFLFRLSQKYPNNFLLGKALIFFNQKNNQTQSSEIKLKQKIEHGYFNIHASFKFTPLLLNKFSRIFFKPFLFIYTAFFRSEKIIFGFKLFYDYFKWLLSKKTYMNELTNKSLRKVVKITEISRNPDNRNNMTPLRVGR